MNIGVFQSNYSINVSECPTLDNVLYKQELLRVDPYQSAQAEFKMKMDVFESKSMHECKGEPFHITYM